MFWWQSALLTFHVRAQTFSGGKVAKQRVAVSITTAGATVKEDKVGKANVLFGPCALEQVTCKVGQKKQKNELTVNHARVEAGTLVPSLFFLYSPAFNRLIFSFFR